MTRAPTVRSSNVGPPDSCTLASRVQSGASDSSGSLCLPAFSIAFGREIEDIEALIYRRSVARRLPIAHVSSVIALSFDSPAPTDAG
jgi:hypothetical protein